MTEEVKLTSILYRAWQRKLYSLVPSDDNRKQLYKYLYLLITTSNPAKFQQRLDAFVDSWAPKEAKFIEYFQSTYANRAGKCYHSYTKLYHMCNTLYIN